MKTNKTALLDVNLLIALIDSSHVSHEAAHGWLEGNREHGWATCPITENGCLRIMSSPSYPYPGLTPEKLRTGLREMMAAEGHQFWPDSVSLLDERLFDIGSKGPKHLTDLYLLGLAVKNGGRLVTFDRSIPWQAVKGFEPENLEVL